MKKIIFIIIFIDFCFVPIAQQKTILRPDGKLYIIGTEINTYELNQINSNDLLKIKMDNLNERNIYQLIDTIGYNDGTFDTSATLNMMDRLLQWFKAPADLTIKSFAFYCTQNDGNYWIENNIVKVQWNEDSLLTATELPRGYYEALNNGFNNITAFWDEPDRTGGWTSIQSEDTEPFGETIWNDGGFSQSVIPHPNSGYQWVKMNILYEPQILEGEIFGIAIRNWSQEVGAAIMGFRAGLIETPGWKFFTNGRYNPGVDYGWWSINLTWDIIVEVELLNPLGSKDDIISKPHEFRLNQNYPNPFNPSTSISFELPVSGLVTLKVFDILGREISTLVNEEKEAGTYQIDFSSGGLSSGIYFYTLTSREYSKTKKMVLLR
jgi:hypothetical protein